MARICYARVSTIEEDLQVQHDRLRREGCEIIRSEKVSGGSREGRTELIPSSSSCAKAMMWPSPGLTGSGAIPAMCSTSFTNASSAARL